MTKPPRASETPPEFSPMSPGELLLQNMKDAQFMELVAAKSSLSQLNTILAERDKEIERLRYELSVATAALKEAREFISDVSPFLERLKHPRFDENETNDYVCGSFDCAKAIAALDALKSKRDGVE